MQPVCLVAVIVKPDQVLLEQLPPHVGDKLVAERLSSINPSRLYGISEQIHTEVRPGTPSPVFSSLFSFHIS